MTPFETQAPRRENSCPKPRRARSESDISDLGGRVARLRPSREPMTGRRVPVPPGLLSGGRG